MPRKPTVRKLNGYWMSEAGGKARYFGKCSEVTQREATAALWAALATATVTVPVSELAEKFLGWLSAHRSVRTHYERSRHLIRFVEMYKGKDAGEIDSSDLEKFLATFGTRAWALRHEVSVRAMYRWGAKHGVIPNGSPFARVEPIKPEAKILLEMDLPTIAELKAILGNCSQELSAFLQVQYATGARSGELRDASVRDYQPTAGQLVLRHHKREKMGISRVIFLNPGAAAIVRDACAGRTDGPIFLSASGIKWSRKVLSTRFIEARTKAGVRSEITPYSLRHLWISEMLMTGADAMLVAKMAGTSVAMIEKVYGRFRVQSLSDAQARLDQSRGSVLP